MPTLTTLISSIAEARKALESGNRQLAEKAVWEMCEVHQRDSNVTEEKDYTPELALLQYQCFEAVLDLHILRGDPIDISIRFTQFMNRFHEDTEHVKRWNKEDWEPIKELVFRVVNKTYQFNQKGIMGDYKPVVRDAECTCALCRRKKADKTGSHMVPHLLIADVFSYDGSRERDKVTVAVNSLGEGKRDRYFGHQVYDDTINQLLGHSLSDEELDEENKKTNALTIDHIFCSECEKRFSVLEDWYAEILKGCKDYPPQIPYLFWMSVVWRMAVGEMGMVLDGHHQEKLRRVLDSCLALKKEDIILKNSKLGHCAYSLYVADDTRDEGLGIYGTYEETKPYQALMGRYFINFYTSLSAAKSFIKAHNLPLEDLNDGTEPEKTGDLNFIEFWMVKRQILDMSWKNGRSIWNIGRSQQKTLSKMQPLPFSGANESGDIPLWLNSENPIVMNVPRSLRKIENWLKEHTDRLNVEDMCKDLGYSQGEIGVMIDYWEMKENERQEKMKERERMIEVLKELVGRV